uniref:Interleukin-1 beta n=1 Tax=Lopholatilus chamaeleonticeps TaxID=390349 RepID=A0A1I9JAW7_9TELE|nr:interleukin 1b [Lopholatilus chamaeleonticeps]
MESKMKCNMTKMWSPKMPEGLDFEITHHPLTMRSVVNLIVAMEKFKGNRSESPLSTEFRDENLLNIMLDSMEEEETVFECFSAPSVQYSRTGEHQCRVTDSENRSLVLVPDSMELHAVMLQGGSENCKVHLNMSTYLDLTPSAGARTVALGITGKTLEDKNLYLSCHKDGEEPTLHLEAVANKDSLLRIGSSSDMERFLFYKHVTGLNNTTFVSVPYSDWYISTAGDDNKPVEMCLENARRHRTFNIQRQS